MTDQEIERVINELLEEKRAKQAREANRKEMFNEFKNEAAKEEKAARTAARELELARLHLGKAQEADDLNVTSNVSESRITYDVDVDDNTVVYTAHEEENVSEKENTEEAEAPVEVIEHKEERVTKTEKKTVGVGRTIVISIITTTLLIGGWHLIKHSKTGSVKTVPTDTKAAEDVKSLPETTVVIDENTKYDTGENTIIVVSEPENTVGTKTEETREAATETEETYVEVIPAESVVSTANFENAVANYANTYSDEYSAVSTADITKFAAIANIDLLAEENPELLNEIANGQNKEEFLNDAAKLIGATVMHNFNVWNSTNSTEGFIRVSNLICGEQKNQMLKIEEYFDRIADAANKGDADLVNAIVSEFILDMNSGDLSKLDDGVGFVAQVNIAMISDGIARNYLNQQNFDMLQILKTSEKYVSNIFRVYEKCTEDAKTRTR